MKISRLAKTGTFTETLINVHCPCKNKINSTHSTERDKHRERERQRERDEIVSKYKREFQCMVSIVGQLQSNPTETEIALIWTL